jgi:hypothetical protein
MARMGVVVCLVALSVALHTHAVAAQCQNDAECKMGRVCRDGACVAAACKKDTDCAGDNVCEAGVCTGVSTAAPTAPVVEVPAAPIPAPATASTQQPVQYRTEKKGIKALIIAGPIVFAVAWITTIIVTSAVSTDEDKGTATSYAAIPLVGPWVMMGSDSLDTSDYTGALVVSGVVQTAGIIMTILGIAIRRERQVPVYASRKFGLEVALNPFVVPERGGGLMAVGTF